MEDTQSGTKKGPMPTTVDDCTRPFFHKMSDVPESTVFGSNYFFEMFEMREKSISSRESESAIQQFLDACCTLTEKSTCDAHHANRCFGCNDMFQDALDKGISMWARSETWLQRNDDVKEFVKTATQRCSVVAAAYIERPSAVCIAGFERAGDGVFVSAEFGLVVKIWHSASQARKLCSSLRRIWQAIFECRIESVRAPIQLLLSVRGTPVSVFAAVPLLDLQPIVPSNGTILRHYIERLCLFLGLPDVLPLYRGADGRFYFACNAVLREFDSAAGDGSSFARREGSRVIPRGSSPTQVKNQILEQFVPAAAQSLEEEMRERKFDAWNAVRSNLVGKVLHESGVNIRFLFAVYLCLGENQESREAVSLEMGFRAMKEAFRSEQFVAGNESAVSATDRLNRLFQCCFSKKSAIWEQQIMAILRKKFDCPDNFMMSINQILLRLAIARFCRLGFLYESRGDAPGRFTKIKGVAVQLPLFATPDYLQHVFQANDVDLEHAAEETAQLKRQQSLILQCETKIYGERSECYQSHKKAVFSFLDSHRLAMPQEGGISAWFVAELNRLSMTFLAAHLLDEDSVISAACDDSIKLFELNLSISQHAALSTLLLDAGQRARRIVCNTYVSNLRRGGKTTEDVSFVVERLAAFAVPDSNAHLLCDAFRLAKAHWSPLWGVLLLRGRLCRALVSVVSASSVFECCADFAGLIENGLELSSRHEDVKRTLLRTFRKAACALVLTKESFEGLHQFKKTAQIAVTQHESMFGNNSAETGICIAYMAVLVLRDRLSSLEGAQRSLFSKFQARIVQLGTLLDDKVLQVLQSEDYLSQLGLISQLLSELGESPAARIVLRFAENTDRCHSFPRVIAAAQTLQFRAVQRILQMMRTRRKRMLLRCVDEEKIERRRIDAARRVEASELLSYHLHALLPVAIRLLEVEETAERTRIDKLQASVSEGEKNVFWRETYEVRRKCRIREKLETSVLFRENSYRIARDRANEVQIEKLKQRADTLRYSVDHHIANVERRSVSPKSPVSKVSKQPAVSSSSESWQVQRERRDVMVQAAKEKQQIASHERTLRRKLKALFVTNVPLVHSEKGKTQQLQAKHFLEICQLCESESSCRDSVLAFEKSGKRKLRREFESILSADYVRELERRGARQLREAEEQRQKAIASQQSQRHQKLTKKWARSSQNALAKNEAEERSRLVAERLSELRDIRMVFVGTIPRTVVQATVPMTTTGKSSSAHRFIRSHAIEISSLISVLCDEELIDRQTIFKEERTSRRFALASHAKLMCEIKSAAFLQRLYSQQVEAEEARQISKVEFQVKNASSRSRIGFIKEINQCSEEERLKRNALQSKSLEILHQIHKLFGDQSHSLLVFQSAFAHLLSRQHNKRKAIADQEESCRATLQCRSIDRAPSADGIKLDHVLSSESVSRLGGLREESSMRIKLRREFESILSADYVRELERRGARQLREAEEQRQKAIASQQSQRHQKLTKKWARSSQNALAKNEAEERSRLVAERLSELRDIRMVFVGTIPRTVVQAIVVRATTATPPGATSNAPQSSNQIECLSREEKIQRRSIESHERSARREATAEQEKILSGIILLRASQHLYNRSYAFLADGRVKCIVESSTSSSKDCCLQEEKNCRAAIESEERSESHMLVCLCNREVVRKLNGPLFKRFIELQEFDARRFACNANSRVLPELAQTRASPDVNLSTRLQHKRPGTQSTLPLLQRGSSRNRVVRSSMH